MKTFKNVKSITFDVMFSGNGLVNADTADAKFAYISSGLLGGQLNDNVRFAKKVIREVGYDVEACEKKYGYQLLVSSQKIHRAMFPGMSDSRSFAADGLIMLNAISQPEYLINGYMFPVKDGMAVTRKSPVTLCSALSDIKTNKIQMSICTNSTTPRADTSMMYEEVVGEEIYYSHGAIDLQLMQFISADPSYDRLQTPAAQGGEIEKTYIECLNRNLGGNFVFADYQKVNAIVPDVSAEHGVLLSEDAVDMMIKMYLRKLMTVKIWSRKMTFCTFGNVVLTVHMSDGSDETVDLENADDIDKYRFEYFPEYKLADEKQRIARLEIFEKLKKTAKDRKDDKEKEKKEKAKKKSKKSDE